MTNMNIPFVDKYYRLGHRGLVARRMQVFGNGLIALPKLKITL